MSAYTTLRITRRMAEVQLIRWAMEAGDWRLKEVLDSILEPRLYNVRIVDNDDPDNDDEIL